MKFQKIVNNKTKCLICPRFCTLYEGQRGFCFIRKNIKGNIVLTSYGYNTGLSIDPVEKKPLYHFYPASSVLSFGTTGCILGCAFCQNYHISKSKIDPETLNKTTPEEIIQIAKKYNVKNVAFTYNDPVAFFEYALDTAKLCKKENIKTTMVTSGYMNLEAGFELLQYIDALNIDLKAFSEKFYNKNCLAKLSPVLEFINYAANKTEAIVELTTMLIEGENDSIDEIKKECNWILDNLGDNIPLHFSGFTPKYKFKDKKKTSFETVLRAYKIAQNEGLKYVYTGNFLNKETSTTYCPKCKKPVIIRDGYRVIENNLKNGHCPYCSEKIYGEF